MKRLYGLIFSLYLNNVFIIGLDIFIIIMTKKFIDNYEMDNYENIDIMTNEIFNFYKIIFTISGIWFLVFFVFTIVNIINAVKKYILQDINILTKYTKTIKIGLIPFWIINFIGYTILVVMINIPSHGFGIFIIPIPIIASYCVLIVTSVFSILFLMLLFKTNNINNKEIILYSIMQICFILDIISIMHLFNKIENKKIMK
jgi:hypothetical protein